MRVNRRASLTTGMRRPSLPSMFDLFVCSAPILCEFCTLPIPIKPDSKVHMVRLEEGPAIVLICPTCGRLQRPRLVKDGKLDLVKLSDEQVETHQILCKLDRMRLQLR